MTQLISTAFNVIIGFIRLIMLPIDTAIANNLSGFSTFISNTGEYFDVLADGMAYAVSYTLLPVQVFQILLVYYSFALVFPFSVYFLKLVFKWFRALK